MIRPLALLPLLLAGCAAAEPPPAPGPPRTADTVSLGRTAVLGPLSVTPLSIVEDSRCAAAVVCVQAGTVRVSTRLETGGRARTETLKLDDPVDSGAGCVVLAKVEPYPVQPGSIAPGDYRLTYRVQAC